MIDSPHIYLSIVEPPDKADFYQAVLTFMEEALSIGTQFTGVFLRGRSVLWASQSDYTAFQNLCTTQAIPVLLCTSAVENHKADIPQWAEIAGLGQLVAADVNSQVQVLHLGSHVVITHDQKRSIILNHPPGHPSLEDDIDLAFAYGAFDINTHLILEEICEILLDEHFIKINPVAQKLESAAFYGVEVDHIQQVQLDHVSWRPWPLKSFQLLELCQDNPEAWSFEL